MSASLASAPGVDADGVGPRLASYNVSLNLTSLGSLFSLPKFWNLIRKGGETMDIPTLIQEAESAQPTPAPDQPPPPGRAHSFPGPWAFFTSGYMLGLLIMVSELS
jgi:hypothetical protein